MKEIDNQTPHQVENQVCHQVRNQARNQVYDQVRDQVFFHVNTQVWREMRVIGEIERRCTRGLLYVGGKRVSHGG